MALSNLGSLVLNLLIFITTLVNFSYALTSLEPLTILGLYAISKIFVTAPEEGIFTKCKLRHLYHDTYSGGLRRNRAADETDKSYTEADSRSADTSRSNHSVDQLEKAFEGSGKIGVWHRIRCCTCIWPTIAMPIGGIANVLHGSRKK
ncbi:hypothetical protein BUE80_DR012431 [Diplocarpon rosae]|nr:hypothetical protein BUE80_DR012431 [Diplocarpon rosae]